jgi:PhnB protein
MDERPPYPGSDDEARFDDESATVGHAEPLETGGAARIAPQLSVRRGREAVAFYQQAFGATIVHQVGGTEEHSEVVAELRVAPGQTFWVADESPQHHNFSPESLGGGSVRLLLQVDDPEAVIDRAVAAGATVVHPATRDYGWLLGRIADPYGHHWEIGTPL